MAVSSIKPPPTLFVMKALSQGGRRYIRGATFPWRDSGITERRALQLLDQRWLSMVHPDELLKAQQQEQDKKAAPKKVAKKTPRRKSKKKAVAKTE